MNRNHWIGIIGGIIVVLLIVFIAYHASVPPAVAPTTTGFVASSTIAATSTQPSQTVTFSNAASSSAGSLTEAQFEAQLQAAINKKEAGDYQGAAQIWLSLTKEAPQSYIAFADLGDLYQNFLHEYPQAETYYLAAIKLYPADISLYTDLYTMYRYQYKIGTSAAGNILARGLAANPGNAELLALQAQYKNGQ